MGGAGGKGKAAATPVAVPNGSVGLTPGSALLAPKSTGGRSAATLGGVASTVARPPRPAKTPGSAATGGSLARMLGQGTPAGGAGACRALALGPLVMPRGWQPPCQQFVLAGQATRCHFWQQPQPMCCPLPCRRRGARVRAARGAGAAVQRAHRQRLPIPAARPHPGRCAAAARRPRVRLGVVCWSVVAQAMHVWRQPWYDPEQGCLHQADQGLGCWFHACLPLRWGSAHARLAWARTNGHPKDPPAPGQLICASPCSCSYDPRTLYVPPEWFKTNKISPGQQQVGGMFGTWPRIVAAPAIPCCTLGANQPSTEAKCGSAACCPAASPSALSSPCSTLPQWWEFKAQNFDSILLFKVRHAAPCCAVLRHVAL